MDLGKHFNRPSPGNYLQGPFPWDAVASGLGSIVSGFANVSATKDTNRTNLQIAREQNQFNYEQWMRERDYNEAMWNKQNEYNTPLAQKQRYTEAGINPYFAMGNIQSGQASALTAPQGKPAAGAVMQVPDYSFIGDAIPKAVSVAQQVANLEGTRYQNHILSTDAQYAQQKVIYGLANLAEKTRHIREQVQSERENRRGMKLLNDLTDRTFEQMVNRAKLENESIEKNMQAVDFDMAYKYSMQSLAYMQFAQDKTESDTRIWSIKQNVAQGWANYALSKQMTNAEISYKAALIGQIGEQNKVIRATHDGIVLANQGKQISLKFQTLNEIADLLQKNAQYWNTQASTEQQKASAYSLIKQSDILEKQFGNKIASQVGAVIAGAAVGVGMSMVAGPEVGIPLGVTTTTGLYPK